MIRIMLVVSRHGCGAEAPFCDDGRICTDSPNEMWGTDRARVFTVDDGWAWVFAAVEH